VDHPADGLLRRVSCRSGRVVVRFWYASLRALEARNGLLAGLTETTRPDPELCVSDCVPARIWGDRALDAFVRARRRLHKATTHGSTTLS
jgi:hypothetical protein